MNQNDTEVTFKGTLYIGEDDTFSIGSGCDGSNIIACLRTILSCNSASSQSKVYNDVEIIVRQKRSRG